MRFTKITFLTTALFAAFSQSALAERWDCQFDTSSAKGWITDTFVAQKVGDSYMIADPIILNSVNEPMTVKARPNNSRRISFSWNLKLRSASSQFVNMRYTLNIRKDNKNQATMRATPLDYAGNLTAAGSCKLGKADPRFEKAIRRALANK